MPAWASAQVNCFTGFNAGDNTTYCEGEAAALDGGYDFYNEVGDPDVGTPTLTWTIVTGSGQFEFDGTTGTTASNINFNNSETGTTGFPDVTFTPDPGVTLVVLRLLGTTSDGPCSGVAEVEDLTLYFDPIQDTPIDAFVNDDQVLNSGDATTTNVVAAESGDVLDLFIDEGFVIDNGQQYDDLRLYEVTYSGPGGFMGLPPAGTYDQNEFETTFNNLTLTSTGCDVGTITMSINAFYDRDLTTVPQPSGPCPGPVTEVEINVNPLPAPVATIGVEDELSAVCEDDGDVQIIVTGNIFTTVTYNISYDGGATNTGDQTIDIDGTGVNTDIIVDATLGSTDEDIIVTLTQIEYTNGPPCPVTISKPVTIDVRPIPMLMIDYVDPADTVLCYGSLIAVYQFSSPSGPGDYTFTYDIIATLLDGTEIIINDEEGDATLLAGDDDLGVGSVVVSNFSDISFGDFGVVTIIIDGESITKVDEEGLSCTNSAPDASITFLIQDDSFVEYEAKVNDGAIQSLTEDNTSLDLVICDGDEVDFYLSAPIGGNSRVPGVDGLMRVELEDPDDLLELGGTGTYYYNIKDNPFGFDQAFDIPNDLTGSQGLSAVITPFFDDNGNGVFDDGDEDPNTDECSGDPITLNLEVRPAPTVTVAISDTLVCSGDDVTVIITASEPGVASLILDQGGDPILVDVNVPDGDNFTGEYDSDDLTALTMFTVTIFNGDVASCGATVNQMVMADVEELPDADISVHPESICNGEDATFTLTGLNGSGDGFSFTYSVNGGTPVVADTDPEATTVDIVLTNNTAAGTITIELLSVRNQLNDDETNLECEQLINETATLSIENVPVVFCDEDDDLCSGDAYSLSFTAGSPDPSAIGSDLYYQIVVTDNTSGVPVVTTTYELASDNPTVDGTAVNMTGFDQTIIVEATPFYFAGTSPDAGDFAEACQGVSCGTVLTVSTMPMASFGGNDAICEGSDGLLTFTGPPNGSVNIQEVDEDGNLIFDYGPFSFDGGGTFTEPFENFTGNPIFRLTNVTDENGCTNDMVFDFAVVITPRPVASFAPATAPAICEGSDQTITLVGTPNATVTIDSDNDANDQTVTLDGDGNGSFTVTGTDDEIFTITDVTITATDNNGDVFTCSANEDEILALAPFELTVNPAPDGSLVTNAIICAGDEPEVQFNNVSAAAGPFDITVNGIDFFNVINGQVLSFAGTAFETLDATTLFELTMITQSDVPGCVDVTDGLIDDVEVVVNEVPEVVVDAFASPICSGDELTLSATATPDESEMGNPLYLEIVVTDGFDGVEAGDVFNVPATSGSDLNAALGLPDAFVNPSTTDNEVLAFTIQPYYESFPDDPQGIDACDGPTSGFTGNFAEGNWTTAIQGNPAVNLVEFTPSTLTLSLLDEGPGDSGTPNGANASYTFATPGTFSFDFDIQLDDNNQGFGAVDVFLVDFEGNLLYTSDAGGLTVSASGEATSVVMPGETLLILLENSTDNFQDANSIAEITNFLFVPMCQSCPGEVEEVELTILPALFADFSSVPTRVCEGDNATICITGTPDATVTVFLGNGIFNDVKLDEHGNGCITTLGGLFADSEFIILGLTTLDDTPQCSFSYEGDGPVAPVAVTPTPSATISLNPTTVCAGDVISAEVNGTENATVSYTLGGVAGSVDLNGDGEGEILLPTVNDGLSDLSYDVVLTGISVTIEDVTCTNDLDDTVTLTVRPLPTGSITAGPAVCAGDEGELFFTAASDLLEGYTVIVLDPNGDELELTANSGGAFLSTNLAGTYTLISITDGTGTDIGCTNTGDFGTAEIIIEEKPDLTADITGTVGTAELDSESHIYNIFRGLVCDEGTINVAFGSSTEDAQALGELMVEVKVNLNDDDQANVGALGTRVITFDELNDADFLDGILDNVDDERVTSIEVVLTPFFENGADAGAMEVEDCQGGTLSFFIDILPAVALEIDADNSTLVVCEGDDIVVSLTGTPFAEVTFSSTGIDLNGDSDDNVVELDDNGEATITGTANGAGTASVSIDMVMVTSLNNAGNISRQCMLMDADEVEIIINEVPEAMLFLEPAGPICNGETVDVNLMLTNTDSEAGDVFTVVVDGDSYTVSVDEDGKAFLFTSAELTSSTCFTLTSIASEECLNDLSGDPVIVGVLVEEIPAGEILVTIDGEETTVADGVPGAFEICANNRVDLEAISLNDGGAGSFTGELTTDDPLWSRDVFGCTVGATNYYDTYAFTITEEDTYTFTMGMSTLDDYLHLYDGPFDPLNPCENFLIRNDDGGPSDGSFSASLITITLDMVPGEYTLVATSFFSFEVGEYEISYGSENGGAVFGLPGAGNLTGESYVSVDYSISEDIDFFGLGQSGTIALPIDDFEAQFSRTYNMIFGSPVTVELAVTYYNENGEVIGLNDGECVGITDNITITINPNPKTEDVATMTCSGIALDYDLDEAITNGVVGATFSYTVASDDIDVSGLDRTTASDANVTDMFTNFSDNDYTVTYTVTPFGTDGDEACQGNDFELVVTVKPQPVITAELEAEVCSGEETLCIIEIDNDIIGAESFELISIVYSDNSSNFVAASGNADVGDSGGLTLITGDVFTNIGSASATVTYTLRPTSAAGCVGEDEVIVVTVLPEAVVADMTIKVCSGGSIDLGFDDLTANGVGDVLSFVRTAGPAVTLLRIFDEEGHDVTGEAWFGGSPSNPGITSISDSYLNTGTGTLSVFYQVAISVAGSDFGDEGAIICDPQTFILEVQVVEEADVVLEPINGQTAICAGDPITLVANYDGSGTHQEYEYTFTSHDGVVLDLVASAAGGEVTVNSVSGSGNATVMVMVTDNNSCVAMATRTVSVGTTPDVMEINGFEDPCTGDPNFYSIAGTDGSTYEWTLSNPAAGSFTNGTQTGDDVSITFNNSQNSGPFELSVTETTAAGCSTTSTLEVTIVTGTTADFSAMQDENDGLTFNFTELAAGGVEAYIWDFGDGVGTSNEQNPSYTYSPVDPDAMETYTVTLTVLGCSGPVSTTMDVVINSTLETDVIVLREGINFISLDVAPDDNRLDAIFSGVSGLHRITTVDDGSASFYQPGAGPFNSLQTAEPGFGYVVIMNNDATLTVTGEPIDDDFIRPMGMGINYMAFVPDGQMVAASFWSDFEAYDEFVLARTFGNNVTPNVQSYFPGFGPFNSMQHTFNGVGYLLLQRDDDAPLAESDLEKSSEDYEFFFGTVSGVDYTPGDPIEILNEEGNVIGHLNPDQSGLFKATPLYGKVESEEGIMMGTFETGERIAFRYQGQVVDAGVSFQGQFAGTELNLDFSNAPVGDELTFSIFPNPANERTSLVLQLTNSTDLSVEAVDATGRIVRTLLPRQTLAAGTTTIEWDNLGQLPAGMYHILVTRDGRIDTSLTQRLVKR